MAAGHPAGRALQDDSVALQGGVGVQRLLVGDDAALHVQHDLGCGLPDPVSRADGPHLQPHCGRQRLHVHLWRDQVVLLVPLRADQVPVVRGRCGMHDPRQHRHRERGRDLGTGGQEAQVLCRAKGRAEVAADQCVRE